MVRNDQAAWYLAQCIAGYAPQDVSPDSFVGEWAEAYAAFSAHGSRNGAGSASLRAWLGQPGREHLRQAVFAHKPGAPAPQPVGQYHLTDFGNAERLADHHAAVLRFVREWGWLAYDDGQWKEDDAYPVRCSKLTVRRIYSEASDMDDEKRRKEIGSWALRSESESRVRALLNLAKHERALKAEPGDFDRHPALLGCANGVLDLESGKLLEHDPKHMMTRKTSCDYDPEAQCPIFLSFLDRIFDGQAELIGYLQRALGYSLGGDTGEQVMFLCYGSGRNGKSTLLETVHALLNDYAQQADATTFLVRASDGVRNDIARMAGVRFAASIEVGEGRRLNETLIKQVTGQDTITARFLHREYFEFRPQFKLWMAANHKPIIRGSDEGIWRRIHLIPFTVVIPKTEVDKKLLGKLRAELPGVLAWMARGYREWQRIGLNPPETVLAATSEYRAEMDVIAAFVKECCVLQPGAKAGAGDLYRAYKAWCERSGEQFENQRAFGMRMNEREDIERDHKNGIWLYRGIGLLDDARDDGQLTFPEGGDD
jgi:putative DNA primase/helicase